MMQIKLDDGVLSLFGDTEVGDIVRVPRGQLYIVTPKFTTEKGGNKKCNAVSLAFGTPEFFAADEEVEVFLNVKFRKE